MGRSERDKVTLRSLQSQSIEQNGEVMNAAKGCSTQRNKQRL